MEDAVGDAPNGLARDAIAASSYRSKTALTQTILRHQLQETDLKCAAALDLQEIRFLRRPGQLTSRSIPCTPAGKVPGNQPPWAVLHSRISHAGAEQTCESKQLIWKGLLAETGADYIQAWRGISHGITR